MRYALGFNAKVDPLTVICMWRIRFTFGGTPVDVLVANIATKVLLATYFSSIDGNGVLQMDILISGVIGAQCSDCGRTTLWNGKTYFDKYLWVSFPSR